MNTCAYWSCQRQIPTNHFLCSEHFDDLRDDFIDQCRKCGRFKDILYELCLDCFNGRQVSNWKAPNDISSRPNRYDREHSESWTKADSVAKKFFVYILKLENGDFYVGQTRELRERLSEHRDSKTMSTANRSPRLQYFEVLPTREAAEIREVELKSIRDANPRQIRRMIIGFQDLIREVKLD